MGPGGQAIDYGSAMRLREISLGVDQAVLDLPSWILGRVVVNKVAFQSQGDGSFLLDSVEDLLESLKGCVILDLYKTVIFRPWSSGCVFPSSPVVPVGPVVPVSLHVIL